MISPDQIPLHIAVPLAITLWAWLIATTIHRARKTDR
jgi:hypothetical protein